MRVMIFAATGMMARGWRQCFSAASREPAATTDGHPPRREPGSQCSGVHAPSDRTQITLSLMPSERG